MLDAFYDFVKNTREYGLLYTANRYYSNYMGGVEKEEDLKDPQGQQRVRVSCFPVTLRVDALPEWAYPVTPYAGKDKGFVMPPDEGDRLWVWFDEGRGDQPRYIGSWWQNDDTQANPKNPDKSYFPQEFKPKDKDTRPTARGWKTKRGHGILMEDNPDTDIGHRVEIWTGEQEEAGAEATKHHHLEMNDKDQFIQINSYGKEGDSEDERWQHAMRFDDKEEFVLVRSAGQSKEDYHYLEMQDKDGYIRIQTAQKKMFMVFEEQSLLIQIKTEGDFTTKWDEQGGIIETTTTGGQKFTMDDNASSNVLVTAGGQEFKQEQAGTTINDPIGYVNITATTASTNMYSADLTETIGANKTATISGNLTKTIGGALSATIAGATAWTGQAFTWTGTTMTWVGTALSMTGTTLSVTAPSVTVTAASVLMGTGNNLPLVNALGLAKFNSHTHLVTGALPGFAIATFGQMIPAVDTTVATLAA